jgi:hypothetical protein
MARMLAIGLSVIGWVAVAKAGPPSALPTRTITPAVAVDSTPFIEITPAPVVAAPQKVTPAVPIGQLVVIAPAPQAQVLQPAPGNVVLAPAPVVQVAPPPARRCPCEQIRPGRVWLTDNRPILIDDRFRYEPRIRDIRYATPSSTLPGSGLGAPDTINVIPPYRARDGYFRFFDMR